MLQPENKIYRDFLIVLQAMLIYKENMPNFDTGMGEESRKSSLASKSDDFEIEMVEDELIELTEQLHLQETQAQPQPVDKSTASKPQRRN